MGPCLNFPRSLELQLLTLFLFQPWVPSLPLSPTLRSTVS